MTSYDPAAVMRLLEKVHGSQVRVEGDGCWTWLGRRDAKGNAVVELDGSRFFVRVALYRMTTGESANGKAVRMTCGTDACVNPAHMRLDKPTPLC